MEHPMSSLQRRAEYSDAAEDYFFFLACSLGLLGVINTALIALILWRVW
jgi:hypothetical protein